MPPLSQDVRTGVFTNRERVRVVGRSHSLHTYVQRKRAHARVYVCRRAGRISLT